MFVLGMKSQYTKKFRPDIRALYVITPQPDFIRNTQIYKVSVSSCTCHHVTHPNSHLNSNDMQVNRSTTATGHTPRNIPELAEKLVRASFPEGLHALAVMEIEGEEAVELGEAALCRGGSRQTGKFVVPERCISVCIDTQGTDGFKLRISHCGDTSFSDD